MTQVDEKHVALINIKIEKKAHAYMNASQEILG